LLFQGGNGGQGRRRAQNNFSGARSPGRILLTVELAGILDGAAFDLFDDQLRDCHAGAEIERRRLLLPPVLHRKSGHAIEFRRIRCNED
jgi:hypothetical protein